MRLLICTHYWRPHLGGIETVAYEQARRLRRLGHEITVVTSATDATRTEVEDGVCVYRLPVWNLLSSRWGVPYPVFSPELVTLLDRLIPEQDVVLTHGHVYLPTLVSAVLCRRYDKPMVLFQHNPFVRFQPPWSGMEHLADATIGRFALRSAAALLSPTRFTAAHVRRLVPSRSVAIIANGVDTHRFRPLHNRSARSALRRRLGLPENGFIALTIRRLVYRNGLDVLLDAAAILRDHEDLSVVIGGRGPEAGLLARRIRTLQLRNCYLAGAIDDDLLPRYYQAADVFVLPTRTGEGFGLVILEAFASGLPVVAAGGGGQDEVIDDERTGILTPPEDSATLAAGIDRLYREPFTRRIMGEQALCDARALDWDRQTEQLAALLTQVGGAHVSLSTREGHGSNE